MIKNILLLLIVGFFLNPNAQASTVEKICSENLIRATQLKESDSEEVLILSLFLDVNTRFEVSIDCKNSKLINSLKRYDQSGNLQSQILPTGTWKWDHKAEIITVRSDYVVPNKKVSLLIKPIISNVTVPDCDQCYSEKVDDGRGHTIERWYDKSGHVISRPKKINLGKKVRFLKNKFNFNLLAGYISSKIDLKNEQRVKAAMLSGDFDLVERIAEDFEGNLDQISSETSFQGVLRFNTSTFLFKGDFLVNNLTIEDEKSFYQAQIIDYSKAFLDFSNPSH